MNRRHTLRVISSAALACGPAVLTYARAASKVRVGISLPLSSVQAGVASDLQAGLSLAFARGRELGVEVAPEWEDDKSDPDRTASAIGAFARDGSFVATTSIVGTPHAIKALPLAVQAGLPVVGLRSGATELRDGRPGVYHLRASFNDELSRMLKHAAGANLGRIAVVYSDDAFGRAAMAHARGIAPNHQVELAATLAAERNGSNVERMVTAAVNASARQPLGLLLLMIAEPMEKGLRHARDVLKYPNTVFAMSFCATRTLAESRVPYMQGLGVMSAFPLPRVDVSPLSQDFVRLAQRLKPGTEQSLSSYEGFVYGSTLVQGLVSAREPTRQGLRQALRPSLNVGGYRIAFDAANVGFNYLQTLRKSHDGILRA